jgi:hypothetical protein
MPLSSVYWQSEAPGPSSRGRSAYAWRVCNESAHQRPGASHPHELNLGLWRMKVGIEHDYQIRNGYEYQRSYPLYSSNFGRDLLYCPHSLLALVL